MNKFGSFLVIVYCFLFSNSDIFPLLSFPVRPLHSRKKLIFLLRIMTIKLLKPNTQDQSSKVYVKLIILVFENGGNTPR